MFTPIRMRQLPPDLQVAEFLGLFLSSSFFFNIIIRTNVSIVPQLVRFKIRN